MAGAVTKFFAVLSACAIVGCEGDDESTDKDEKTLADSGVSAGEHKPDSATPSEEPDAAPAEADCPELGPECPGLGGGCYLVRMPDRTQCLWDCVGPDEEPGDGKWARGAAENIIRAHCEAAPPSEDDYPAE